MHKKLLRMDAKMLVDFTPSRTLASEILEKTENELYNRAMSKAERECLERDKIFLQKLLKRDEEKHASENLTNQFL